MGDESSPERKFLEKLGVGADVLKAFDAAKSIVGTAASIFSVYGGAIQAIGFAKSMLEALGFLEPAKDPLTLLQEHIDKLMKEVFAKLDMVVGEIHKTSVQHTKENIAENLGDARAALGSIVLLMRENASIAGQVPHSLHASLSALQTLQQDAFWQRPFYDGWIFKNPWLGAMPPPHNDNVFDYRFILPAYIEVLTLRIVILGLCGRDYSKHEPAFEELAGHLLQVHDRILAAIVPLRPPTEEEAAPRYTERLRSLRPEGYHLTWEVSHEWDFQPSQWDVHGRWYGAAELYSAMDGTEAYPPVPFPILPMPPVYRTFEYGPGPDMYNQPARGSIIDEAAYWKAKNDYDMIRAVYEDVFRIVYRRFLLQHAVRTLKRRKEVYRAVGLPAILSIVREMMRLAQKPWPDTSDFGAWSLRDAWVAVDERADGTLTAPSGSDVSLRSLAHALGSVETGRVSLRDLASV